MPLIQRLIHRLRAEDGFTLVTVMGVIGIVMILSAAAFAATNGDQRPGLTDRDRKEAYSAAEAAVNDYLAQLTANPDYWRKCTAEEDRAKTNRPPLNQVNPGAAREWKTVPGTAAEYSIELLPANAGTADNPSGTCNADDPVATFIDKDSGTFRIRATGRARAGDGQVHRSLIATFRRRGFLDYIYFTEYETGDPAMFLVDAAGRETRKSQSNTQNVVQWATATCKRRWHETPSRKDQRYGGQILDGGQWRSYNPQCVEIQFVGNGNGQDKVEGPFHTNDSVLICGNPKFGRSPADEIEVSGPGPTAPATDWGYRPNDGCTANPVANFNGTSITNAGVWQKNSPIVSLPATNAAMENEALPAYRFKGRTTIVFNGSMMTVTGKRESGQTLTNVEMPVPEDGVIYVDDDGTCGGYNPRNPEASLTTCGDAWVSGTYAKSMTVFAANDILVRSNLTATGTAKPLLGLIANYFVRVDSPVNSSCNGGSSSSEMTIHAAILALAHSFTVDRYWCGSKLGELNIVGAIGQMFRGPVGTGNATSGTGYIKDYDYNDELRFRSPPRFLDPVQTTWRLKSQVEQVPPAR